MSNKREIIAFINRVVKREHGIPFREESDKLINTGVDSFGFVMVLLELEDEFGVYTKEETSDMNLKELTLGDMVKRILDESN